jgi:hypothetical protein
MWLVRLGSSQFAEGTRWRMIAFRFLGGDNHRGRVGYRQAG